MRRSYGWTIALLAVSCTAQQEEETRGIRRIPASQKANYTEWIPCLDELPTSLRPFAKEYRKTTRDPTYTSLSCAPKTCFRTVLDGFEHLLEMEDLEEMADQVALLLNPYSSGTLESSIRRQQTFSGRSATAGQDPFEQFHVDYFEVADYVMTGLVYGEPSSNLQGGESGFADAFVKKEDDKVELQEGLVVEPKKGRLLLFSGGGENFHGPLPIRERTQERPTTILFFKCQTEEKEAEKTEL